MAEVKELSLQDIITDELFEKELLTVIQKKVLETASARKKYGRLKRNVWDSLDEKLHIFNPFSRAPKVQIVIDQWFLIMNQKSRLSSLERTAIQHLFSEAIKNYLLTLKTQLDEK